MIKDQKMWWECKCKEVFDDWDDAVEHVRKCHHNISRPAALGCYDSHGHCWYCFECETDWKDHRSYGSSKAMLHHLIDCHGCGTFIRFKPENIYDDL